MRFLAHISKAALLSYRELTHGLYVSIAGKEKGLKVMQRFSKIFLQERLSLKIDIRRSQMIKDDQQYLFVHLNQRSLLDALLACAVLPSVLSKPVSVFANIEFLLIPFYGWALWIAGAQVVVRQRPSWAKLALNTLISRMKREDQSWMMSIEGRRSLDGSLSPYKKGAAIAAASSGIPIVPYITRGTWEYVQWFGTDKQPRAVVMELLDPIESGGKEKDDLMSDICKAAERALGTKPTIYSSRKRIP